MKWYLTMILPYHSLTSYFSFWHLSPPDISLSLLESKYQEGKGFICIAYYITNQALLFNCQVVSDFLRPHGLQHTRLPCPSPSPRVCSNSCPLNRWCHPTISSSVASSSSCLLFFPASGSFPMSQVANVLKHQLQHQSFQWIVRIDFL